MDMIKESDLKILFSAEKIQEKISELGIKLNNDYKEEPIYNHY